MHSLVNVTLGRAISQRFGAEEWASVCAQARLAPEAVSLLRRADPSTTWSLVDAAAARMQTSPDEVIDVFARHLTTDPAARSLIAKLLGFAGREFTRVIEDLDSFHDRIALAFPEFDPPYLGSTHAGTGDWLVTYQSDTTRLAPFVPSLLRAAGTMLAAHVAAEPAGPCDRDSSAAAFHVRCNREVCAA